MPDTKACSHSGSKSARCCVENAQNIFLTTTNLAKSIQQVIAPAPKPLTHKHNIRIGTPNGLNCYMSVKSKSPAVLVMALVVAERSLAGYRPTRSKSRATFKDDMLGGNYKFLEDRDRLGGYIDQPSSSVILGTCSRRFCRCSESPVFARPSTWR